MVGSGGLLLSIMVGIDYYKLDLLGRGTFTLYMAHRLLLSEAATLSLAPFLNQELYRTRPSHSKD